LHFLICDSTVPFQMIYLWLWQACQNFHFITSRDGPWQAKKYCPCQMLILQNTRQIWGPATPKMQSQQKYKGSGRKWAAGSLFSLPPRLIQGHRILRFLQVQWVQISVTCTEWRKDAMGTAYLLTQGPPWLAWETQQCADWWAQMCVCWPHCHTDSYSLSWLTGSVVGEVYSPACVPTMHIPQLWTSNLSLAPANVSFNPTIVILCSTRFELDTQYVNIMCMSPAAVMCSWFLDGDVTW
jgi:hypothetical protein